MDDGRGNGGKNDEMCRNAEESAGFGKNVPKVEFELINK